MNTQKLDWQNSYLERASGSADRIMALGIINKLNTNPPTPFFLGQLRRATVSYCSGEIMRYTILDLRRVEMVEEIAELAKKLSISASQLQLGQL